MHLCCHWWTKRTAFVRFEVALPEKFSHAMTVQGLTIGGSLIVRRMRAFGKANAVDRSGILEVAPADLLSSLFLWTRCCPTSYKEDQECALKLEISHMMFTANTTDAKFSATFFTLPVSICRRPTNP